MIFIESIMDPFDAPTAVMMSGNNGADIDYGPRGPQLRGNMLIHTLNGHVMSVVVDDDLPNRAAEGLIGVQVHVGGPMKVEYRNWRLKNL